MGITSFSLQQTKGAERKRLANARLPSAVSVELLCLLPLEWGSDVVHDVCTTTLYYTTQRLSIPSVAFVQL